MLGQCTVYFEDPFWIAVFERQDEIGYQVARFVFGSEPGSAELHQFALRQYQRLTFSNTHPAPLDWQGPVRFKRRQREIRRSQSVEIRPGTRSQAALQAEQERRLGQLAQQHQIE